MSEEIAKVIEIVASTYLLMEQGELSVDDVYDNLIEIEKRLLEIKARCE